MLGRFDEARAILAETRAELAERGGGIRLAVTSPASSPSTSSSWPAILPRPPSSAQRVAGSWRSLGSKSFLSSAAGSLARALYALDRLDEADAWAGRAAELGGSDDASAQMLWRQVQGKGPARAAASTPRRSGSRARRWRSAKETDDLNGQGDAYADLAEVLALGGKPADASAALQQALGCYERKGNRVSARRTQVRLVELQDEAPR